ncbi:cupin domain-containing protein [Sphingopyxis sp. LARHCG72]
MNRIHHKFAAATLALAFGAAPIQAQVANQAPRPVHKTLLPFEESMGKDTSVEEITIGVGQRMDLGGFPEERLYYVLDGRGILSVYDKFPDGDTYNIRPDISLYFTPGLKHELFNTGTSPLRLVVFRVKGGIVPPNVPDGAVYWPTVSKPGVTVDKPAVGTGFWITYAFDEHSNTSVTEGQRLQVRRLGLRRAQKFAGAELLVLGENGKTRPSVGGDTNSTGYIISGEGNWVRDGKRYPFKAGAVRVGQPGALQFTENTAGYPITYIAISTFPDKTPR